MLYSLFWRLPVGLNNENILHGSSVLANRPILESAL